MNVAFSVLPSFEGTQIITGRRRFCVFSELWRNENGLTMSVRETSRPADALQSIMTETAQ